MEENEKSKKVLFEINEQATYDTLPALFLLKFYESGTPLDLAKAINSVIKQLDTEDGKIEEKQEIINYIGRKCLTFLANEVDDSKKTNLLESITDFCYDFYQDEEDIVVMKSLFTLLSIVYLARTVPIKELKNLEDNITKIIWAREGIKEVIREEYEETDEYKEKVLLGEIDPDQEGDEILPDFVAVSEMIIDCITETGFNFLTDRIEFPKFFNFSPN